MIEVERKFVIQDSNPAFLQKSKARFLGEIINTDTYYDDEEFSLTTKNIWIRKRNDKFELKKPFAQNLIDRFEEIIDERAIRKYLDLPDNLPMESALAEKNYTPFLTYKTNRISYSIPPFKIDLDYVNFGKWDYRVGEIELLITDSRQIDEAIASIEKFAKDNDLVLEKTPGKLLNYLKRYSPEHYQALIQAGVIQ